MTQSFAICGIRGARILRLEDTAKRLPGKVRDALTTRGAYKFGEVKVSRSAVPTGLASRLIDTHAIRLIARRVALRTANSDWRRNCLEAGTIVAVETRTKGGAGIS